MVEAAQIRKWLAVDFVVVDKFAFSVAGQYAATRKPYVAHVLKERVDPVRNRHQRREAAAWTGGADGLYPQQDMHEHAYLIHRVDIGAALSRNQCERRNRVHRCKALIHTARGRCHERGVSLHGGSNPLIGTSGFHFSPPAKEWYNKTMAA